MRRTRAFACDSGLWALSGGKLDERYGAFMDNAELEILDAIDAVFDAWGREIRPPLDATFVSALFGALHGGAAIRHLTNPEIFGNDRYAKACMALAMGMIRLHGDQRTMDDRLAEMNYYPGDRRSTRGGGRSADTRSRIIESAAFLFGQHGYEATTITMIARTGSVSDNAVYDHFRTKANIAIALLEAQADAALTDPPAAQSEPVAALIARLVAVADFVLARTDHARPFVTGLLFNDGTVPNDARLRTFVRDGIIPRVAAGALREADVDILTDFALTTVLARVIAAPSAGSADAAEWTYAALAQPVSPSNSNPTSN